MTELTKILEGVQHRQPEAVSLARAIWSQMPAEELANIPFERTVRVSSICYAQMQVRAPGEIRIQTFSESASERTGGAVTSIVVIVDNAPFVTDSVLIALTHDGLHTHHILNLVYHADRDSTGQVISANYNVNVRAQQSLSSNEVLIYAEIDPLIDEDIRHIETRLTTALQNVQAVIADFPVMRSRLKEITASLQTAILPHKDLEEASDFLDWLGNDHFVFLGYREFEYTDGVVRQVPESELGMLRLRRPATERRMADQPERVQSFLMAPTTISFSKSGTRSLVHRWAYPDYVGIRRFDENGNVIGEAGFLGLYTMRVYLERPEEIPVIREKVRAVVDASPFTRGGFDDKVYNHVLATYPRDELFELDVARLQEMTTGITYIFGRRRTRVFTRVDPYGLFANCLVYIPRDLYDTYARRGIERLLMTAFDAVDCEFEPYFSESSLVRLQLVLRLKPGSFPQVDESTLTAQVIALIGDFRTELRQVLIRRVGRTRANDFWTRFEDVLPAGYEEFYSANEAVNDMLNIDDLSEAEPVAVCLYRDDKDENQSVHIKLLSLGEAMPLSEVVPKLEHMGFAVTDENRFSLELKTGEVISIQDFGLEYHSALDIDAVKDRFTECLRQLWRGAAEDDLFNALVISANIDWRDANLLRAYGYYMRQLLPGFSTRFIATTLAKHPDIAMNILKLFYQRLSPNVMADLSLEKDLRDAAVAGIEEVPILNEDRVLRRYVEFVEATERTNYFQSDRESISLKFAPTRIRDVPAPVPFAEIYVFSPSVEGLHLRGGAIARGGLRWSDRGEDYRTEVLGLVKAQVVKNAVIVPTGAKGGFVVRDNSDGISCYRTFIRGLLDVTDNIREGVIVPPEEVRRRDADDAYLVVAADKGTATFSDTANGIAQEYDFWLDDAFASGGSVGYDHKKLGITAKGAWESVDRHFGELGIDVATQSITVLGIGDMSGDVFGNGMLLSTSLKLIAAFNHRHIFIDPDPDPAVSFAERKRLFALQGSSWADYEKTLISTGGGVYPRSLKTIRLSAQAKDIFGISVDELSPDELIHQLLRSNVDLIFNGGVGTYFKATRQTHEQAQDRTNDNLRVNAGDMRCRVFAEGGNLGATQEARIEFALKGGHVNADFIDNSAGVDCSDHEVNLKIALNHGVASGLITATERLALIRELEAEVAGIVLISNRRQARALALAEQHARESIAEYERLIVILQRDAGLDPELQRIPSMEEIRQRGLTRPELAVLMAYAKIHIKQALLDSDIDTDSVISRLVYDLFPATLVERFPNLLLEHQLRREIIATQIANDIVHQMGLSFITSLCDQAGATVREAVVAFFAASMLFRINARFDGIENAGDITLAQKDADMMALMLLGRQGSRWLLRHHVAQQSVERIVGYFKPHLPDGDVVSFAALIVVDTALKTKKDPEKVQIAFDSLRELLAFDALQERVRRLRVNSHWDQLEFWQLRDDIVSFQASLAGHICDLPGNLTNETGFLGKWFDTLAELEDDAGHTSIRVILRRLQQLAELYKVV